MLKRSVTEKLKSDSLCTFHSRKSKPSSVITNNGHNCRYKYKLDRSIVLGGEQKEMDVAFKGFSFYGCNSSVGFFCWNIPNVVLNRSGCLRAINNAQESFKRPHHLRR